MPKLIELPDGKTVLLSPSRGAPNQRKAPNQRDDAAAERVWYRFTGTAEWKLASTETVPEALEKIEGCSTAEMVDSRLSASLAVIPVTISGVRFLVSGVPVPAGKVVDVNDLDWMDDHDRLQTQRLVAVQLARLGIKTGPAFRAVRTALQMHAKTFAALLRIRPETVSAWENERSPVPLAEWGMVCALLLESLGEHVSLRDVLAAARRELRPNGPIEIVYR